jgi:signal peptide peptidase SppA
MKTIRLTVLIIYVIPYLACQVGRQQAFAMKAFDDDDDGVDHEHDEITQNNSIELNPYYVEPEEDDDDSVVENCDDDRMESINSTKATKSMLSKALAKPKRVVQLLRRHKSTIMVFLVIYAFRKELARLFYRMVSAPVYDSNGKSIGRSLSISPTSILKLIFLLQFLIRNLAISGGGNDVGLNLPSDSSSSPASLYFQRFVRSHVYVPPIEQHWTFERLNERYDKDEMALWKAMGEYPSTTYNNNKTATISSATGILRELLFHHQEIEPKQSRYHGTAIVMDLTRLTTTVAQMEWIRDEVSLILSLHKANQTRLTSLKDSLDADTLPQLEVIVLLESPGGGAADYGLAAQQLLRLRQELGIELTICVDKVAASGGYMMAATGHKILAAPFAVIGSIGVYGQAINIHKVLEGWGVTDLIFRAGKNKAPLGLIGEVTQDGRDTIQTMIDSTHAAFKHHVVTARPILETNINDIATGDVWLGHDAIHVGLVDRILTSDEYIGEKIKQGMRVLKLVKYKKSSFLFGARSSGSDYSVANWGLDMLTNFKQRLVSSVEASSLEKIPIQCTPSRVVNAKSPMY